MWLVANDIIIGLAIGSFLMANNAAMADKLHRILHVTNKRKIRLGLRKIMIF